MNEWKSPAQPVRCMVDLSAPLVVRYAKGVLVQGDENANAIVAEVYQREGVPFDLTGCTATLTFIRPDNMAAAPIAAEISGNVAVATLTDLCYTKSGTYVASLQLKKDGAERTIVRIVGEIVSSENSGTVTEEQILPTPEELLATLLEVEEARNNANAAAEAANEAAERAGTAANSVNEATGRANAAAASIEGMTASANQLEPDAHATATVTDVDGVKHITFGIPRGEKGEKGDKGDPGTAENVTIDSIAGLRDELNAKQPKGNYLPAGGTAEDASKLGGKMPEEYLAANGTAVNAQDAQKLGGKLPEEYLAADGTAANASKLGGKLPEEYATKEDLEDIDIPTGVTNVAYNLLDNSNFKNPVNQRRADGTISAVGYFIDRWKLMSGSVTVGDDGLTLNGEIAQIIETAPAADVTAEASAGTASFDAKTNTFSLTASGELIEWAALYEGEYTAENMPTYVPKEYAVEFLECQRYFVTFNNYGNYLLPIANGYMANTNTARLLIRLPLPMRTTPTFGAFNVPTNGIQVRAGNNVFEGATVTVLGKTENGVVIHCVLPSGKTTTAHDTMSLGFAPTSGGTAYLYFSADL